MAKYTSSSKRTTNKTTTNDMKPSSSLEFRIKLLEETLKVSNQELIKTQTKVKILQDQNNLLNGWIKTQFGIDLISTESPQVVGGGSTEGIASSSGKAARKRISGSKSTAAPAPMKIKTEIDNNLIHDDDDSDQETEPLSMSQLMNVNSQGSLKQLENKELKIILERIDINTTTTRTGTGLKKGAAGPSKKTTDKRQSEGNVQDQDQDHLFESNPPTPCTNTKKPKKSTIIRLSCELCDKPFLRYYNLMQHKQLAHPDGDQRSFLCKHCQLGFSQNCLLINHIQIHHNPNRKKVHQCKICLASYYFRYGLLRHIRHKHNGGNGNVNGSSGSKIQRLKVRNL